MYSNEKLISEVQNYLCLWDMSSRDDGDNNLKKCMLNDGSGGIMF